MKILFIGCVHFSHATLKHTIALPQVRVVGVVTQKTSHINSDFCSLEGLANQNNIPVICVNGNNQTEILLWIKKLKPDIIYCFGWSFLLGREILISTPLGVIGYHPAALPQNRGRHPIIWALALGLKETASTFFFMDDGADSGDILSQVRVTISSDDTADTLYKKLIDVSLKQISEFTLLLATNCYNKFAQDHSRANYWRKRGKTDGMIDWRMSAKTIYNLVRALTKPYVGAHCLYKGEEVRIWKTEIEQSDAQFINLEPGKIVHIKNEVITVKCGQGVLKLLEHDFEGRLREGDYL